MLKTKWRTQLRRSKVFPNSNRCYSGSIPWSKGGKNPKKYVEIGTILPLSEVKGVLD
jgi:hypothetical protein